MITKIENILNIVKQKENKKIAVVCAHDLEVIEASFYAKKENIADAILLGDKEKIHEIAKENSIDISNFEIIDIKDETECALEAVKLVSSKKASMLMKGLISTSGFLKAVLNKEFGLRTGNLLSHFTIFEIEKYHKLLALTDAAINITPDLNAKISMINNSVSILKKLEIETPYIAAVCAVETVNEQMPCTLEAALLAKMNERGQIKNCIIDGPLGFDNAISKEAAKIKKINSKVAGDADLLLFPNIESANVTYKTLSFLTNSKNASIVAGAKAPIILTSRSESWETKLNSIALASFIS
jgi:phosphate butyryltransferase